MIGADFASFGRPPRTTIMMAALCYTGRSCLISVRSSLRLHITNTSHCPGTILAICTKYTGSTGRCPLATLSPLGRRTHSTRRCRCGREFNGDGHVVWAKSWGRRIAANDGRQEYLRRCWLLRSGQGSFVTSLKSDLDNLSHSHNDNRWRTTRTSLRRVRRPALPFTMS